MTTDTKQVFAGSFSCPICGGNKDLPSGKGVRCYGFQSGDYAHCSREEHAGSLTIEGGGTFAHFLAGDCHCGKRHDGGVTASRNGYTPKGELVAIYDYRQGFIKRCFALPNGEKFFAWEPKGARMEDQPLWRSWDLKDGPVIFCEGEKACDALRAAGYQAVTNAGGAGQTKFGKALDVLRGREVYLWPDNDQTGARLMDRLEVLLMPITSSVKRIIWADAPPTGDAFDALAADVDVHMLIDTAEAVNQQEQERHLTLTKASNIKPQRVRWAWAERIALGTVALLAGREGTGKSTFGYWLGARITKGELAGEYYGEPRAIVICATEDSWAHTIVPRLMAAALTWTWCTA